MDQENAWSLNEAFPWLRKHLYENPDVEFYDPDAKLGDIQARDGQWDEIIYTSALDLKTSKIDELLSYLEWIPPSQQFSEIFPFLPGALKIEDLKLKARAYNCLRREGYEFFEDISKVNIEVVNDIRNLGAFSSTEIFNTLFRFNLRAAIEAWTSGTTITPPIIQDTSVAAQGIKDLLERAELQKRIADALDLIGKWRDVSMEAHGFSLMALDMELLEDEARDSLAEAASTLRNAVSDIEKSLPPMFDVFSSLDLAAQDVIARRICSEQKLNLQEIGDIHGVTRERIRQLETNAKQIYEITVEGDSRLRYLTNFLKTKMKPLEQRADVLAKFPNVSIYPNLRDLSDLDLIFGFDSSFYVFDNLVSTISRDELEKSITQLAKSTATVGLLSESKFITLLEAEIGNGQVAFDFGITNQLFELRLGLIIPARIGLTELAALALAGKGEPMSFDELSEIVLNGRSERSFRNALFADPRFIRSSLTDWALAEWDVDEYTNIKDEILEVLDEVGTISLEQLVEMLTSKYGVSASSVATYASMWPFENINGFISKSDSSQVSFVKPLPNQKEIFKVNGDLMIRLKFGPEQQRGSGSNVSKAVASILRLNHGEIQEFNFPSHGLNLKISYVGLQPSLGSVRELASSIGAEPGDNLFISLGQKNEIYRLDGGSSLVIENLEEFLGFKITLSPKEEIRRIFAELLSLDSSETFPSIFSALRNRGEFDLEAELRQLVGDNQAFDLEINLKNDSKFKISQIDDLN